MKTITIDSNQIESEEAVCMYCGDTWKFNHKGCCGENHWCNAYILVNNAVDISGNPIYEDWLDADYTEVEEAKIELTEQEKLDIKASLIYDFRGDR